MYTIVEHFTSYSKKLGAHEKSITIEKGILTIEAAHDYIKLNKPRAKKISETEYRTSGLLYPGKLIIKGKLTPK